MLNKDMTAVENLYNYEHQRESQHIHSLHTKTSFYLFKKYYHTLKPFVYMF